MAAAASKVKTVTRTVGKKAKELAEAAAKRARSSASAANAKAREWAKTDTGKRAMSAGGAVGSGFVGAIAAGELADKYPERSALISAGVAGVGVLLIMVADDPRVLAAGGALAGVGGAGLAGEFQTWMAEQKAKKELEEQAKKSRTSGARYGCPPQRIGYVENGYPVTPQNASRAARLGYVEAGSTVSPQGAARAAMRGAFM